jgi:hypothetical protein
LEKRAIFWREVEAMRLICDFFFAAKEMTNVEENWVTLNQIWELENLFEKFVRKFLFKLPLMSYTGL